MAEGPRSAARPPIRRAAGQDKLTGPMRGARLLRRRYQGTRRTGLLRPQQRRLSRWDLRSSRGQDGRSPGSFLRQDELEGPGSIQKFMATTRLPKQEMGRLRLPACQVVARLV